MAAKLSDKLTEYVATHNVAPADPNPQIEQKLTDVVNDLLNDLPEDPFAYLNQYFDQVR